MRIRIRIQNFWLNTNPDPGFPSNPVLQNMKFLTYFLLLWVIFALLDPDPDSGSRSGYGFIDLIESGSNPDPDPKH
jgi:hypothetical protein